MGSYQVSKEAIHNEAQKMLFGLYSSKEILQLSSCEITNPIGFNQLGHPQTGGLYDLRMGPFTDKNDLMCSTCFLHCDHCPGHLGHIDLPLPVCNPLFYTNILKILKMSCITCHSFRVPNHDRALFLAQQKLLEKGLIVEAQEAHSILSTDYTTGEQASSTFDQIAVVNKLNQYLTDVLNDKDVVQSKNTRNVEALRKLYIKDFIQSHSGKGVCSSCRAVTRKIVNYKSRFIYEGSQRKEEEDNKVASGKEKTELNPEELRRHFRELWLKDADLLTYLFPMLSQSDCDTPTDMFFINIIAVPPPKTRPCQFTGGTMTLHPQSIALQNVVETVIIMKQLLQVIQGRDVDNLSIEAKEMLRVLKGESTINKLDTIWKELQTSVDHVLDREMNSNNNSGWGFKQLIERKTGIFRMHMMGKRVNYAARTVITPDPNISVDEIGLPEVFAKKLSYRVPVTPFNAEELRQLVMNGPNVHPGALYVESDKGHRKMINPNNPVQREALAKTLLTDMENQETKYVYRHLKSGDCLLLNRQPTLHKPSIMSHRARILKGEKVMRLHYAVCKSYNADFDGDEMNAHFPQNEIARSEAYNIVSVCKHYLVPKDGSPLQGLIQDHIIAGVKMTIRGKFFTREEYQQLVYSALINVTGPIKIMPPTIIKPICLWSGKQVISTVILNLVPPQKPAPTMTSSAKIKSGEWVRSQSRKWNTKLKKHIKKKECQMCESEVIFRQGELLSGVMDKNQYGATMYSLVHAFYELYGGTYSAALLSSFSKLFTNYLHTEGFTLGVHDILVTDQANEERKTIMLETREIGDECAAAGVSLKGSCEEVKLELERFHRESRLLPRKRVEVDSAYKDRLGPANNRINSCCLPNGLIKKFPDNNLQLMVQAGAKGSTVNTMQISCLLGQIELEGKRPPLMISGKSLPSFVPYDTHPKAGGFIDGRFMTGIRPQEFFFHCMAGREGLIDTAVKTSRSGYLQRCLIKLLEGLVVNYDLTVRDSDGSVVQFQYGEDSLDVCKSQYLVSNQVEFLEKNMDAVVNPETKRLAGFHCKLYEKEIEKRKVEAARFLARCQKRRRDGPFLKFSRKYGKSQMVSNDVVDPSNGRSRKTRQLLDMWSSNEDDVQRHYTKKYLKSVDPCHSTFRPDSNYGSITEKVDAIIEDYIHNMKDPSVGDKFREILYLKYMKSIADPGEPVGVLAAQSVGEPSTQMTLNTFHFAGRGEMNVTLGIPRLREILMVASNKIKTPSCTVPFKPKVTEKEQDALRLLLNRCILNDVLEYVGVTELLQVRKERKRFVKMKFHFLPRKSYKNDFCVSPSTVLNYFETYFIQKVLLSVMSSAMRDKKVVIESASTETGTSNEDGNENNESSENIVDLAEKRGVGEEHASSDEEEQPDDADATEVRKKARQDDNDYDEGLSDEEVEMIHQIEKEDSEECETMAASQIDDGESTNELRKRKNFGPSEVQRRRMYVINLMQKSSLTNIIDYTFDTEKELWAELTLSFPIEKKNLDISNVVRKAVTKGIVHEVKNINKSFLTKDELNQACLVTDGINIDAMYKYDDLLDLNRLTCNNIHDMARYYGIEAANRTITKEIVNVFKAYGIIVNHRHLSLIADYMTFDGSYKPFNRIGIENNTSPLQQMTFETAIGFLRSAALGGKSDTLESPSSCLVLGKPCFGGTGTFKVIQKLNC